MKVKLKRSIIANSKQQKVGDIVTLSDKEASFLISRDLAEEYEAVEPPVAPTPHEKTTQDSAVKSSDKPTTEQ